MGGIGKRDALVVAEVRAIIRTLPTLTYSCQFCGNGSGRIVGALKEGRALWNNEDRFIRHQMPFQQSVEDEMPLFIFGWCHNDES